MVAADDIAVVVPVYNHPHRLREMVLGCLAVHPHVLVVDDGSDEPVAALLEDLPIRVIRHETNLGKGRAIRTAADAAHRLGLTHLITIDADGQHDPAEIPLFVQAVKDHPQRIVIGVRDMSGPDVPRANRFGRAFGNFWVAVQTGRRVGDIQSGYRAYPIWVLRGVKTRMGGYAYEVEVVVRALWGGVGVHRLPIGVHYPKASERISHFDTTRDNMRLALLNTHLTFRSVLPHRKLYPDGVQPISLLHPIRSLRAVMEQDGTPGRLAMAATVGVFLGALPLLGVHTLAILVVAAALRVNRFVAVAASQLCMPPVIPAVCIEVGSLLRRGELLTWEHVEAIKDMTFPEIGFAGLERLGDWFFGSLLVGPAFSLMVGITVFLLTITTRRLARG